MVFRFMICYLIKTIEFEWNLNLDPNTIIFNLNAGGKISFWFLNTYDFRRRKWRLDNEINIVLNTQGVL